MSDNQGARNKNNKNVGIKSNVRGLWPTCLYRDVGWDKLSWCLSVWGQRASGDINGLKVHYSRRWTCLSSLDTSTVLGAKEGRSMLCLDLFLFFASFPYYKSQGVKLLIQGVKKFKVSKNCCQIIILKIYFIYTPAIFLSPISMKHFHFLNVGFYSYHGSWKMIPQHLKSPLFHHSWGWLHSIYLLGYLQVCSWFLSIVFREGYLHCSNSSVWGFSNIFYELKIISLSWSFIVSQPTPRVQV